MKLRLGWILALAGWTLVLPAPVSAEVRRIEIDIDGYLCGL